MPALLGLWLSESSKGKVPSLKGMSWDEWGRPAAAPECRNTPKDAQTPWSISRISATCPEFCNPTRTLETQYHLHEPSDIHEHTRTYIRQNLSHIPRTLGPRWSKLWCEGCGNLGTPIAYHPPIPAFGSLSATVPLKSSTPPRASVQRQRILKGCSGPGRGAAPLPACAAWPLCEPVNKGPRCIQPHASQRARGPQCPPHAWNSPWHTPVSTPDPIQCPGGSAVGC